MWGTSDHLLMRSPWVNNKRSHYRLWSTWWTMVCWVAVIPWALCSLMTPKYSGGLAPLTTEELQKDLDKLMKWSEEWQPRFNASKCKAVQLKIYEPVTYYLPGNNGTVSLELTQAERDLGVNHCWQALIQQPCRETDKQGKPNPRNDWCFLHIFLDGPIVWKLYCELVRLRVWKRCVVSYVHEICQIAWKCPKTSHSSSSWAQELELPGKT